MDYTRLGTTGLEVSRLCFGCMSFGNPDGKRPWVLDEDKARPLFRQAWEAGVTFFDTADIYATGDSEVITGKVLAEIAPRDHYVLATKLFNRMRPGPNGAGLGRKAIFAHLDDSLRRLGTDYVDLYQIHRWDYFTPIEETLEALNDAVRAGKVRYIGASSMYAWQFAKALFTSKMNGWARFVSMQCQLSLVAREEQREMLPLCEDQGVGVIPWSPLGSGRLTRPWGAATERSRTDIFDKSMYDDPASADRAIVEAVAQIAQARGVAMATVAMAWTMRQQAVTAPILGATKAAHVSDAVAALDVALTDEEIAALEAPYRPRPAPDYLEKANHAARGRLPE